MDGTIDGTIDQNNASSNKVKNGSNNGSNNVKKRNMSTKAKDTNTCQTCPKDRIARRMIGTTTMNTTITYGPVVDLQPPHVVGGQQTFAVVGDQGIRQTTGRNAHAVVAVWG